MHPLQQCDRLGQAFLPVMRRFGDGRAEPAEGGTKRSGGGGKNKFRPERTRSRSSAAWASGSLSSCSACSSSTADSASTAANRPAVRASVGSSCAACAGESACAAGASTGSAAAPYRSFRRSSRPRGAIAAFCPSASASAAHGRNHISNTSGRGRHTPAAAASPSTGRIFFADTSGTAFSAAPRAGKRLFGGSVVRFAQIRDVLRPERECGVSR